MKLRRGMMASLSGALATMGCGVPYAIGAKFAHPGRPVIAMCGDGAMQMNGTSELLTIKKYWKEWKNPQLIVLVLHNNDLNQVTWEMRAMAGDTRYVASQELPDFEYAAFAGMIGLRGIRVDAAQQLDIVHRSDAHLARLRHFSSGSHAASHLSVTGLRRRRHASIAKGPGPAASSVAMQAR